MFPLPSVRALGFGLLGNRSAKQENENDQAATVLERQLRTKGLTVPRNDLFVATVAIRTGLPVSCRDAHFDVVKRVVGDQLVVEQL